MQIICGLSLDRVLSVANQSHTQHITGDGSYPSGFCYKCRVNHRNFSPPLACHVLL